MLRLGSALLLCLAGSLAFGVTVGKTWDRLFGGNPETVSRVVDAAVGNDGSIYALVALNQGTATQTDVVVSRYSTTGAVVWTTTLPDLGNQEDHPQRIALVPLRGGGAALVHTAIRTLGDGSTQLDVRRLNPTTGAALWSRSYPGFSDARVLAVNPPGVPDLDHNVDDFFVGGSQLGPLGGSDAVVYRFLADGTLLSQARWNRYSLGKATLLDLQFQERGLFGTVSFQSGGYQQGPYGGLGIVRWADSRSLNADRSVILGESDLLFGGFGGLEQQLAVATNDPRSNSANLSVFDSDFIRLWDFAYSYRGLGSYPVGVHSSQEGLTRWRLISNNRTDSGQAVVITTWRNSIYPSSVQVFEEENAEFEAQAFAATTPGTLVAGRTLGNANGWWILRHATGAPSFWFREGQPFQVRRVIPAYRGYLVLGEQQATNGSTVGRLTFMGLSYAPTSFTISPGTTPGGTVARARVQIEEDAPLGGTNFILFSDNPNVRVPASITVPQGRREVEFDVTTLAVTTPITANIRVGKNASARWATLRVRPADVSSLQVTPLPGPKLYGGESLRLRIALDGKAPTGGSRVSIFNGASLGLPTQATVLAGQSQVEVTGTALRTSIARDFTVSARLIRTLAVPVRVEAPILVRVESPAGVRGGTAAPVRLVTRGRSNVRLNAVYTPSNSLTTATVIPVPAGALEATGSILTRATHETAGGTFRYVSSDVRWDVGLLRRAPAQLTMTPTRARVGGRVTFRVDLDQPAPETIQFQVISAGWDFTILLARGERSKSATWPVWPATAPGDYDVLLREDFVPHDRKLFTVLP